MGREATETREQEADRPEAEWLLSGYSGCVLVLLSVGLLSIQLGRQLLPNLMPAIVDDLAISPFLAGVALSVLLGFHALLQFPGGRLSDRLSRKTVLAGSLSISIVGYTILFTAGSYPLFLLGLAFAGIGSGLFYTPMRSLLADLYVARRGQAFGVSQAAGSAGGVLAAVLAAGVLVQFTWRVAFVPLLGTFVLVAFVLHSVGRESYVVASVSLRPGETVRRLLRDRQIRWLLLAYSLYTFAFLGVIGFLPTFLRVEKGFSTPLASLGFAALSATGMAVMPLAGRLSDQISRTTVGASALAVSTAGLLILLVTASLIPVLLGVVCFATGMSAYAPTMQAYLMDLFPEESIGGDFGAVKTIYTTAGSLGPTYVGFAAGQTDYVVAFGGFVLALGAGAIIVRGPVCG